MLLDGNKVAARAHAAAEARLNLAYAILAAEEGDLDEELPEGYLAIAERELAGPFCGCQTCIIREVLDAAQLTMAVLGALNYSHS